MLAAATLGNGSVRAQMHHTEAPEHVTRAIGVYEWTGDLTKPTAARFVPVSLFINGHFEDAGLYLARPVPFALQPGDLYDLEHAGEPQGVLDLNMARRAVTGNAAADGNSEGTWYAFGRFTPQPEAKTHPLRPSTHLAKLETSAGPNTPVGTKLPAGDPDTDRPHMNRRDNTTGSTPSSTSDTGSTPGSTDAGTRTSNDSSNRSSGGSSNDDEVDRPTLRHRDPAQDAARRKEANAKSKSASVTAAGPALGDDPDRPILGHNTADDAGTPELTGLPAGLHQAVGVSDAGHRDAHAFDRPWESPAERAETLSALAAIARTRLGSYLTTNRLVASSLPLPPVSSPGDTNGGLMAPVTAHSDTSSAPGGTAVSPDADTDTTAPPKLQRGIPGGHNNPSAQAKTGTGDTPTSNPSKTVPATTTSAGNTTPAARASVAHHPTHSAGASAAHPATLTLGAEEIAGFTLSYGGLPTFVYTATASVGARSVSTVHAVGSSPSASRASAVLAPAAQVQPTAAFVTLVAQRLPSGELQVALADVTDNAHLDRSPRLRLVDAVDPDGSHRASLLLELRGATSRQFALYRLISAHAEQTFTTAAIE